jgi:hypothetical protein
MRPIVVALFAFFIVTTGLSQPPSKEQKTVQNPSQAQIQAQMNQAKNEAQQQITELENDIAEAKKNEEDPETIKDLENQLALMKKMLGIMDKTDLISKGKPKTIPPTKTVLPKYVSPIVPVFLKQPVVAPTEAQAKDKLLWYKGKKLNDSMLVTTKKMVVLYSRRRNMVIVKPDEKKDTSILGIVNILSKTEKYKNDFATQIKGVENSFLMFPQVLEAYKEYDFVKEEYNEIVKNTIDLPTPESNQHAVFFNHTSIGKGSVYIDFEINPDPNSIGLEEMYKQLVDLMNNQPSLDFPAPPKRPNDLCLCNPDLRKNYQVEMSQWSEQFWGYEEKLLESVKGLQKYLTDNSNANITEIPNINADLSRAFNLVISRKDEKVKALAERYASAVLANEREKQKLGVIETTSAAMAQIKSRLENDIAFERYIDEEMTRRNYATVFDYSLYLNHEFHRQLFGIHSNANIEFNRWQESLQKFNRFLLWIDMDFEWHVKNDNDELLEISTGTLELNPPHERSTNNGQGILVSLGRLNCKWQLFLTNTNYESGEETDFRLPIKVKGGTKRIKKGQVWEEYPYTGPPDMLMVFPSVRIDFCTPGSKDSAVLDVLRYKNDIFNQQQVNVHDLAGEYLDDRLDHGLNYTVDLMFYANKMFVGIEKTQANAEQLIDLAEEMMNVRSMAHIDNPTGNSLLDELGIEYSVNLQQHEKQLKLTEISKVPHTIMLFNAMNNSETLIDETIDTANEEKAIELTRGKIHLRVKHAPLDWRIQGRRNF